MAAAPGTALLRSMATTMGMAVGPRAPSLHRHPLFLPGLRGSRPGPTSSRHHSSSSSAPSGSAPPPPTNSKELTQNKNVPGELNSAKAASVRKLAIMASLASFMLFGTGFLLLFSVMPRIEALSDEVRDLRRQRSILIKALEERQRTDTEDQDVLAKSLQLLEQVKKLSDGQQALDD
ncbi:unnamed protein product [Urochloa decumbens]|uniref:Uncharacterized protein n=1 Tax=Urochloa decumbens TaxID=240449 RepID=A0ABC8VEC3_9POAL